jgi:PqqD family protein of HPr-rel-A system
LIAPRFRIGDAVRVHHFGDESVVFNPLTWETHVLNPAASLAVRRLQQDACGIRELSALLEAELEESERASAQQHAASLIDTLRAMHLLSVEPATDACP